jgi:HEAT repeat protein
MIRNHRSMVIVLLAAGCASNVNDLLEEAKSGDPESVEEAVIQLGEILRRKEEGGYAYDEGDAEAIIYLKEVAAKSTDPLNRARAMSSLALLKRPELGDVFLSGLDDKFWIVQIEAAKGLAAKPYPEAAPKLAKHIDAEHRMEVRLALIKALQAAGGDAALEALLRVFLDRTSRFRNMKIAAYEGVRALSGREYAFDDAESWQRVYDDRFGSKKEDGKPAEGPSGPAVPVGTPETRDG